MRQFKVRVAQKAPWKKIEEEKISSIYIERVVLGQIITTGDFSEISVDLKIYDFFEEKNQLVYIAIFELSDANRPIDTRSVFEQLKRNGTCEEAGGIAYLLRLTDSIVSKRHIEEQLLILKQYSYLRKLMVVAEDVLESAQDPRQDVFSLIDSMIERGYAISQDAHGYVQDWDHIYSQAIQKINEGKNKISTGYRKLDDFIGGWKQGNVVVIGVRPSTKKSTLIANFSYKVVKQNIPVAIFSLEMSVSQFFPRLESLGANIPIRNINRGDWAPDTKKKIEEESAKLFLCDKPALDISSFGSMCRKLVNQRGVRVVFVDYLKLINVANMPKNSIREQFISSFFRRLKVIARDLNIAIVVAQFNRESNSRVDNSKPQLHDLMDSCAIEQCADTIVLLNISSSNGLEGEKDVTELIVAKNRSGKTGMFKLKL